MLGIFRNGELHTVVESPGATTFFSDKIYTSVEADTIEQLIIGKKKPSTLKLREVFGDRAREMVKKLNIDVKKLDAEPIYTKVK